MASSLNIHLVGYEALSDRLMALPETVRRKVVRPALRAGAKVVAIRVKATSYSRRMRRAPWKIRAVARSRTRIGFQVQSPRRPDLGIGGQEGYWPAYQELGWRPGRSIAHDPSLVVAPGRRTMIDRNGRTITVKVKRGLNVREARLLANKHRRKIPGRWQFRAALLGSSAMIFSEIARAATERMTRLGLDTGGAAGLNDFEEGGA